MDVVKNKPSGRPLTDHERRIVEAMLHSGVAQREKWLSQMNMYLVEDLDDDDSLIFQHPPTDAIGQTKIAEAEYIDSDGMVVELSARAAGEFLHVIDIFRTGDNQRVLAPIDPNKIDVYWPAKTGAKGWWQE